MKILFVSWELDPFFKLGGLGDVAESLPGALHEKGIDIRNVIPFYKALKLRGRTKVHKGSFVFSYAKKKEKVNVFEVTHPTSHVLVYLLQNKRYMDVPKSPDTFAFFQAAVVHMIVDKILDWTPEIIHCNDHHTGLIPLLVKEVKLPVKTLLTIHNLSYQGIYGLDVLDRLEIGHLHNRIMDWEIRSRKLNFLMEGIIHADVITTVSPTYAKEIMREEYGMGLEEILRGKEGRVMGILNGIDLFYNEEVHKKRVKFPYLPLENGILHKAKEQNKLYLQKKLGLKRGSSIPLFSFIGRFDPNQKGIDILHKMMRREVENSFELVILGTGSSEWEERFAWLSTFYPQKISCTFKFDEARAMEIYAASDYIIIPSRFEPCGLIQMIAMQHGTIPIAHKTGGLADSIKNGVNGFLFDDYTSEALEKTVKKAIELYTKDQVKFREISQAAIEANFSWGKSAEQYIGLYEKLLLGSL